MIEINNRIDAQQFAQRVQRFMDKNGTGLILTVCHLNTYPDDTHYCCGHGLYGDNRNAEDCRFKDYCRELYEMNERTCLED